MEHPFSLAVIHRESIGRKSRFAALVFRAKPSPGPPDPLTMR